MKKPVTVVVPTCNAGTAFYKFCEMLQYQTANIKQTIVIDTSSIDNTVTIAKEAGFTVIVIEQKEFGHGKTRQMALEMAESEIVCFMTQDALLADKNSLERLVQYLLQNDLGAAYGRQLPYPDTGVLEAFARIYNYPTQSFVNTFEDRKQKGFKTAFLSDTFAAYKKNVLLKTGGFPVYSNFGEDSYVAAKMLMAGYKTGYCAEAAVYHAHDYSFKQEWNRSMAIKQFHRSEEWILKSFGKPEGEGVKFVSAQIHYLVQHGFWRMIPIAILQDIIKYIGYKAG